MTVGKQRNKRHRGIITKIYDHLINNFRFITRLGKREQIYFIATQKSKFVPFSHSQQWNYTPHQLTNLLVKLWITTYKTRMIKNRKKGDRKINLSPFLLASLTFRPIQLVFLQAHLCQNFQASRKKFYDQYNVHHHMKMSYQSDH
jgi:hypothetical protein